jgi:DNA-binding transcriptional LysR family regulator
MELGQLEAMIAVARSRSFAQAAQEIGRTQPAVSIAVKKLEEEIGAPLFDRVRRDIRLTAAGEIFYDYAVKILNLRAQSKESIDELRKLQTGKVRIGANESTSLYLLPEAILSFRAQFPAIRVEAFRSSSVQLPYEIKERNLDLGIISYDTEDPDIESFPLMEDELVLIVLPNHPLTKKRKVMLADLGAEVFIAHNVHSPSRQHVIEIFRKKRVPLNIGIELSNIETIKDFVRRKMGIAFIPRLCVEKELADAEFRVVRVQDFHHIRTIRAILLKDSNHSHAALQFLRVLLESKGRKVERRGLRLLDL